MAYHLNNRDKIISVMRKMCFLLTACFLLLKGNAQLENPNIDSLEKVIADLHRVDYPVFQKGEKFEYLVHYGWIDAGIATISVKNNINGDRNLLQVVGKGESKGAFNWFFKVRDHYESHIDVANMRPVRFIRKVSEGGYKFEQDYQFDQEAGKVMTEKKDTITVPSGIQDMMSAYYFARTLDISKYEIGDVIVMHAIVDGEIEPLKIRYQGREEVKIKSGKFKCLKFQPLVQPGRIFNDPEDLTVYITDDLNKIPILVKADVLVGSIKMELQHYQGIMHPLAKIE